MKLIDSLIGRAKELDNGLNSGLYVSSIILDNEAFIVNMNSEEQLYEKGITREGVSIADYAPYHPLTIEIKKAKGQPTSRVTLMDEGDFYNSFFVEVRGDRFEIKAGDFKTEKLMMQYGAEILGLTQENIKELIWMYIYPKLQEQTKKVLYGNP